MECQPDICKVDVYFSYGSCPTSGRSIVESHIGLADAAHSALLTVGENNRLEPHSRGTCESRISTKQPRRARAWHGGIAQHGGHFAFSSRGKT
jgi:hypothetical protein